MWFNSKQREEPYLGLTCWCKPVETSVPLRSTSTGAAWLSSARVVRCWVKSRNERNPRSQLPASHVGNSRETAGVKPEEGGDDVKSSWPLRPGRHTCYNGRYRASLTRKGTLIAKSRSKFGLWAATRPHEAGIASNRGSATPRRIRSRALYTPPVTPWKLGGPEAGGLTRKGGSRQRSIQ